MIKPLGDRVVIEVSEGDVKTASGIVLPDTAKEKPQKGKVVAVGTGKILENGQRAAIDVKAGDSIIFSKYAGTEIKEDGKDYLIVSERDILAVVE
ncbi:chaperonin GroES [Propionispira arboris]|jgi:chaperonin GroES|uniref:Co-chaperonin GroES n=1 Tax=Propionispira arboris TaxID=84035 RepID=A0A1H7B397_9FIRM|nr:MULTISPECIES: co-chaperone GroES [Propionispira]SEJ70717.1 chaperonin GroES [Propionispira arboris]